MGNILFHLSGRKLSGILGGKLLKRFFLITGILLLFVAPVLAERLSVSVREANIRSGPGFEHGIIWKADRYYPLNIIKKAGEWRQFRDFEGDEGWIHQSIISVAPSVITIRENCNIRSAPSTDADVKFTVESGIPFKVIKRENKWIQIEHADGDGGWIYESLVW